MVPRRVCVAPVSFGLGDLVISLPAVQGLVQSGAETWLVARSPSQARLAARIDGLAGTVREEDLGAAPAPFEYKNLRDHPLQRDAWWGSPEFARAHGKLSINEILQRICDDLSVPADFSQPRPLRALPRDDVRDDVVLLAGTDGPSKRWPVEAWRDLARRLLDRGRAARVLVTEYADGAADVAAAGIDVVVAASLEDAVDVLTSCAGAVGIDGGLTHVAVQQGTPTVALHRPEPIFFRAYRHTRLVLGDACAPECVDRSLASAHNARVELVAFRHRPWDCDATARCMRAIGVDRVLGALAELGVA
jgi:ADP-heptose:LPS heptosyltransferase